MNRRRFIVAGAAALALTRPAAAQTPAADPLDRAVAMAQREITIGLALPDAPFDMSAERSQDVYFPTLSAGVTAYRDAGAAEAAFGAWRAQLDGDPGTWMNAGEHEPRLPRVGFDPALLTDQATAWRQPYQTSGYPEATAFDAVTLLARQDDAVHLWTMTPGKNGAFGPAEAPLLTLARLWLPEHPGPGPYDRAALMALLPNADDVTGLPGFRDTYAVDETYGELP